MRNDIKIAIIIVSCILILIFALVAAGRKVNVNTDKQVDGLDQELMQILTMGLYMLLQMERTESSTQSRYFVIISWILIMMNIFHMNTCWMVLMHRQITHMQ